MQVFEKYAILWGQVSDNYCDPPSRKLWRSDRGKSEHSESRKGWEK